MIRISTILLLAALSLACTEPQSKTDNSLFDQLCAIYESTVTQPGSISEKEGHLAETIKREHPDFFNKHYVNLLKTDRSQVYGFMQQLAEINSQDDWQCKTMKKYYQGKYDQQQPR